MNTFECSLTGDLKSSKLPAVIEFDSIDQDSFIDWYLKNQEDVDSTILKLGALLLRGIKIEDPGDFEFISTSITEEFTDYVDGNSPRTKLTSKVYTSTEYDKNYPITLHNELSYSSSWPSRLLFCCIQNAQQGGETPIADSRKIVKKMDPGLVDEIEKKGLKYIRNLNPGQGIGPSWQETFETTEPGKVEEYCKKNNIQFSWTAGGSIRLIQHRPGTIHHPVTKEKVWFNQVDQFHPSHLQPEIYETLMLMCNDEDELPTYITFGDDSPIGNDVIKEIRDTVDSLATSFTWSKGDLLIVDNVLTCHGRNPYSGERQILVTMSK